ncbi:amino acid adenylation domain-containing protein [Streptomyces sp. NPDC052721]|uniref:amino acid adenylation domain-containing protein n=1 Tax=Streptomyces sp. NPDC052721 TaxID=3154955 RepID=UPI00342B2C6D
MDTREQQTPPRPDVAALRQALLRKRLRGRGGDADAVTPRGGSGPAPLSPVQRGMWAMDHFLPDNSVYGIDHVVRLRGHVDPEVLGRALTDLVDRHEALRTTFDDTDGPRQVVHPHWTGTLVVRDVRDLPPDGQREAAEHVVARERARSFDLRVGPLFRAALVVGSGESLLVLTVHHLVSDGWSVGLIAAELSALYRARLAGQPLPPPPPLQYADYAQWQAGLRKSGAVAGRLDHRRTVLRDVPPVLDLPTDHERPPRLSHRGHSAHRDLPPELAAAVRQLAEREGVTLFTLLLTAFDLLLGRWSGRRRFAVGAAVSGRTRTEIESVVGLFANTVAIPADLTGNPSFSELTARVNAQVLDALDHQDIAFEEVVAALALPRDAARNPLYQVLFQCTEAGGDRWDLPGVTAEHLPGDTASSKVDLLLSVVHSPDRIALELVAEATLFAPETGRRLLGHLETLLAQVVRDPARPVEEVSLLSAAETDIVTKEWNDTFRPYPADATIPELFARTCARVPDATALVAGTTVMTYAELDAASSRLAHLLRANGARADVPVAVALPRSAELVVVLLAVLKAGAAYLVLDSANPVERNEALLADSGATLLVRGSAGTDETPLAADGAVRVLDLDDPAAAAALAAQPAVPPPCPATPQSLAYVSYTSGSTGRPKGVMVPHRAVIRLVHEPTYARLGERETLLQIAPVAFDASTMELWGSLLTGARLVVAPPGRLGVAEIGALLREHRVTVVFLTTGLFHQIAEYDPGAFAHVRHLLTGGDVVSPGAVRAALGAHDALTVVACYGPTENTTYTTCAPLTAPEQVGARVSLGRPIQQTTVYVLDAHMRPVPVGTPGELYTGGDGVARGYLGRAARTAERFLPDPFSDTPGARMYATGDLVRYRPDGTLDFIGRIDGQVKLRGFRIELGEIEARLLAHPRVAQAAVVVTEHIPGHKRLVAYTAPAGADRAPTEELRAHLRHALPAYMVPQAFVALDTLPLKPNGKVDRDLLPAPGPDQAGDPAPGRGRRPATPTERTLAGIWARVLHVTEVGAHDNFFELGGDSILSIRTVAEAARAGLRLTPRQVFEHQTIAALAASVDRSADTGRLAGAEQGTVSGDVELLPVHRWFTEQDWPHHHHNQSVRLSWTPRPDPAVLAAALRTLTAHHDALRLRLVRDAAGDWQEHIAEREEGDLLRVVDLTGVPEADREAVITREADRAHAAMDLTAGPVLRAVLFRAGPDAPDQLFWTIHHLAVDTVSWAVLLEDLAAVYGQLASGRKPALPAKTTSYRAWAARIARHAQSPRFAAEAAAWVSAGRDAEPLPADHTGGRNTEAAAASLTATLPEPETTALLRQAPAAYRTRVNDLLLTALAQTLCAWTGSRTASVHLEAHGREPLFDDVDLTRTVGWFTSIHPVHLTLPPQDDPAAHLKAVKEQLRAHPHNGIGYGLARYLRPDTAEVLARYAPPQVSFNYHGRIADADHTRDTAAGPLLRRLGPVGAEVAASGLRPHLVDVDAAVLDGALRIRWTYAPGVHDAGTVRRLADDFLRRLRLLVGHCASGAAGATPSDFPLARLDQRGLDQLLAGLDARGIETVHGLSPMQTGLLFHALHRPGRGDYVTQLVWRVEGELDTSAFLAAWQHVTDRHAALRTTFAWDGVPEPVQIVHRHLPLPAETVDWSDDPDRVGARLADLLDAERRTGFDLRGAPPHRLHLIRTGPGEHLLVWHNHHILLDGWSVSLVLAEVRACYASLSRDGRPPQLPEPTPYQHHIAWLHSQDTTAAHAYWRSAMEGFAGPTPLPVVAGAQEGTGATTTRPLALPATVTSALSRLAGANKVTVNTVLQAAWALTLARYSGTSDVLFGNTLTERMSGVPGADRMVGLLINTLPTRVRVAEDRPVGDWLRELHARLTEAQRYGYLSVSEIQRHTAVPGGQRLFDSILVFTDTGAVADDEPAGLRFTPVTGHEQPGYPLLVRADLAGELVLTLNYEQGQVAADAAERLLRHFGRLLTELASGRYTVVRDLPMLSDEELRELTASGADDGPPAGDTLLDLFAAQVRAAPRAVALRHAGRSTTYARLDADSDRLAHRLRRAGAGPGTRVAVHLRPSAGTVTALLAVLKAGAAYVPLDPAYPAQRRAFVLEDSGAVLVLSSGATPPVPGRAVPVLDVDGPGEEEPGGPPLPRPTGRDLAYTIYTSGSTGRPKGVDIEHRAIAHFLGAMRDRLGSGAQDTWLSLTSISFDIAGLEIFLPLVTGARTVVAPADTATDPEGLVALIREEGVSFVQATPSGWRVLLAGGFDEPSVRALCGGEPLPAALARDLVRRCRTLWNVYGPTETTVWSTIDPVADPDRPVTIGRPLPGERVHVLDSALRPVPVGVPGELFIGGHGVGRGYLGRPALTAERFVPDPFGPEGGRLYRTGDRARLLPDGRVDFLGRLDRQAKVRGYRIELGEIEARLDEHTSVGQSVVEVSRTAGGTATLTAYVVPVPGHRPAGRELREHLAQCLPEYMVPHVFVLLPRLPLTPNGKVDRNALPAPEGDGRPDERPYVTPRTAAERVLAAVCAQVLEVERFGVRDDFFDRGGDSIRALLVMTRARAAGVPVTVAQIVRHRTVEAIAAAADRPPSSAPGLTVSTFLDRLRPDDADLTAVLTAHRVPGVSAAVIKDGALTATWAHGTAHRGAPGTLTDGTVFQAGSLAKHVTALLCLLLVRDGTLDLDQDVNRYLDGWRVRGADGHGAVSLRALLSHSAGLPVAPGRDFGPGEPLPPLAESAAPGRGTPPRLEADGRHVGRFRYSNTNYAVVQRILEDVGGRPVADLARDRLFAPLGLRHTVLSPGVPFPAGEVASGHDAEGRPLAGRWRRTPELAGAGLWSTPRDLAALELEIWHAATGGSGHRLLDGELAREMIRPAAEGVYGLGTMLRQVSGGTWFGHLGEPSGARCLSFLDAGRGSGFVLMLNAESGTAAVREFLSRLGFAEELAV